MSSKHAAPVRVFSKMSIDSAVNSGKVCRAATEAISRVLFFSVARKAAIIPLGALLPVRSSSLTRASRTGNPMHL